MTDTITSQDRIDSVCKQRGIPKIKVNQPCLVEGKEGVIVNGNSSANFNVKFTESGMIYNCHPCFKMKILSMDRKEIVFEDLV
tara:strand:- start:226 stop:474 length:249 start_codon:yes stop_codon:yes gene_type:complete